MLTAALAHDIYIPHLRFLHDSPRFGYRLCLAEIEGARGREP